MSTRRKIQQNHILAKTQTLFSQHSNLFPSKTQIHFDYHLNSSNTNYAAVSLPQQRSLVVLCYEAHRKMRSLIPVYGMVILKLLSDISFFSFYTRFYTLR